MNVEAITTDQLLTVGGITAVTFLVVAVIFRAAAFSDAFKDRFGALIAAAVGILFAVLASIVLVQPTTGNTLLQAVLTGLVGGLAAVGVNEIVSNVGGSA
jgi:multisubunit Na+/H+ antiporter MnhB subunit